jgi:cation-transporting P-type ATPase E
VTATRFDRTPDVATITPAAGLTAAEVADRVARDLVNDVPRAPSRTVAQIVRANVFTYFNALIGALLVLILIVDPGADALFGVVLVANVVIGIVQEVRAKRTLDRLSILNAPKARVVRDGVNVELATHEVVVDDLLELRVGDQVIVDGTVVDSAGLEIDESLLTGESEPVAKGQHDGVLSGAFVAAGSGRYQATKVGAEAYAARLAEEARRFTLTASPLRQGVDGILRLVTIAMIPAAALLVWGQYQADVGFMEAARGAVAGLVAMVPEGLVLLTSVAFAVGVVRLGRRQCLVQELAAVEVLARVSVICLDKTGTLTDGSISVRAVEPLGHGDGAAAAAAAASLSALARSDPNPNATMAAVRTWLEKQGIPDPGWRASSTIPFSSARKWSGAVFDGQGTVVIGAPEILLAAAADDDRGLEHLGRHVNDLAGVGQRVVLVGRADGAPDGEQLPPGLQPVALVILAEHVREDAPDTIRFFADQGVEMRVISGDNPVTVGAVARSIGVPGAEHPYDARQLPEDIDALAEVVRDHTVFGRVTPHQKRNMVKALQSLGHTVAMTGDGVNDVLALKDADLGIAMGNGSPATRAVAQIVLLDGRFSTMPHVVAEGRRIIANIERVANLFVTKTVYALLLAVTIGIAAAPYPFLPRHLTVVSSIAIGIPGFFLALAPANQRARPEFAKRVLRFAFPAGIVVGTGVLIAYALARTGDGGTLDQHRTAAAIVLIALSLVVLGLVIRPITPWRLGLVALMGGLAVLAFALPVGRRFYELHRPPDAPLTEVVVVAVAGAALLEILWRSAVLRITGVHGGGDLEESDRRGPDGSTPADKAQPQRRSHPLLTVVDVAVGADPVRADADGGHQPRPAGRS